MRLSKFLRKATTTGWKQVKIKIWTKMEIEAMGILKELINKVVEDKDKKDAEADLKSSLAWIMSLNSLRAVKELWKIMRHFLAAGWECHVERTLGRRGLQVVSRSREEELGRDHSSEVRSLIESRPV